jgi:hypothetical protein
MKPSKSFFRQLLSYHCLNIGFDARYNLGFANLFKTTDSGTVKMGLSGSGVSICLVEEKK